MQAPALQSPGSMFTAGGDTGETGGHCPTSGEALIHGFSNVQEGPGINNVSLAAKGRAKTLTEELPHPESITKGSEVIKDKLEDRCWVWAKPAGRARRVPQFQGHLSESRKVTHNTLGEVCGSWPGLISRSTYILPEAPVHSQRHYLLEELCF